jgi:hypothetical protein
MPLYWVTMLGDRYVLSYDWLNGANFYNFYCNSKSKEDFIYATSCFLRLNQQKSCVQNNVLLDLVLTNINNLSVSVSGNMLVATDYYHQPLVLSFKLNYDSQYTCLISGVIMGTQLICYLIIPNIILSDRVFYVQILLIMQFIIS